MDHVTPDGADRDVAPLRSSVEKIGELAAMLPELSPDDEQGARILQLLMNLTPHLRVLLPDDPDRLDEMLLVLAKWALLGRSDYAEQPATIEELLA